MVASSRSRTVLTARGVASWCGSARPGDRQHEHPDRRRRGGPPGRPRRAGARGGPRGDRGAHRRGGVDAPRARGDRPGAARPHAARHLRHGRDEEGPRARSRPGGGGHHRVLVDRGRDRRHEAGRLPLHPEAVQERGGPPHHPQGARAPPAQGREPRAQGAAPRPLRLRPHHRRSRSRSSRCSTSSGSRRRRRATS